MNILVNLRDINAQHDVAKRDNKMPNECQFHLKKVEWFVDNKHFDLKVFVFQFKFKFKLSIDF
jgi:hypothetical protein